MPEFRLADRWGHVHTIIPMLYRAETMRIRSRLHDMGVVTTGTFNDLILPGGVEVLPGMVIDVHGAAGLRTADVRHFEEFAAMEWFLPPKADAETPAKEEANAE